MPNYLILIYVFAGIGVLDTLYLVYHKFKGTDVSCYFFPPEWCRKVQYAPQSRTLGIPNSMAGLGMYLLILILALLYQGAYIVFWPIQAVIAFGFLFSLYFTYVQAFVLRAFCTWCVISAVNFLVLAAAAFILH